MSDLWNPRRRNTHTASSDAAFRRYNDVLPLPPRHRGRSQTRAQNELPSISDCPPSSSSRMPSTASKLMTSVKRSLSYGAHQKKRSSSLAVRKSLINIAKRVLLTLYARFRMQECFQRQKRVFPRLPHLTAHTICVILGQP